MEYERTACIQIMAWATLTGSKGDGPKTRPRARYHGQTGHIYDCNGLSWRLAALLQVILRHAMVLPGN